MQINWDSFKAYNQDSRGIRYKFEDLCRQLFANENISGNKQFRYLHANPNNAGLETEPIYDEVNKRWIGFQAKFFDDDVDYNLIRDSAKMILKHYTGQDGIVNVVFLFSNQPITSTSKSYIAIVELLKKEKIELKLITDSAILDLVRNKYPYLGFYYFGNHTLTPDWFINHSRMMYDDLGKRYNPNFNVATKFTDELSLFVHDQKAVDYINAKKKQLLKKIEEIYKNNYRNRNYLRTLGDIVSSLPDVDIETLYHSVEWIDKVLNGVQTFIVKFSEKRKCLEEKKNERYALSEQMAVEEKESAKREYYNLCDEINDINSLIELPQLITITSRERQLLYSNFLALFGKAGTGKTQLLASKAHSLELENRTVLFLIAEIYFTDDPIQDQIMRNLNLNYSFEDLIDVLENIGEKENIIVPVFIDAINETWNKKLWKIGLTSILEKINMAPMVKLVISYRTEYENLVLPDSVCKEKKLGNVVSMRHNGFENNSFSAVKLFMDHYHISFTPLEYFSYEMSNPLFLTLYCETYNGEEVSLPELYNRIVLRANLNIYRILEKELNSKGYSENDNFLGPLITQIAEYLVTNNKRAIPKEKLVHLSFWTEYGVTAVAVVNLLKKEHILYDSVLDGKETFYFAFDQMNDYYCAKAIMDIYNSKDEVCNYLLNNVLAIKNGILNNYWNIDLFVNACALYAEKYNEECIEIIDCIEDDNDKYRIFSRYIESYQWRDSKYISKERFENLIKRYPCEPDVLWRMLIGNSVKLSNPLNADYLHEFLSNFELNRRDYLWTIFINTLTWDESERIFQLIHMYDRGEKLECKNEKQKELLLTLFGWLLTSSNRYLRDYSSKAMVEILKEHFQLCQPILEKFKNVNDPYVIQRLYGITFGASCKRKGGNLQTLAEYVYENIFNQEKVYPDILLRDYARLIIERFLFESPDYCGGIDKNKIIPPYNSDPIPELEDRFYEKKEYNGAMFRLIMSMMIEPLGGYGDFGRYVFQRALHSFEVDHKKMFNYAIYHIIHILGFTEDYFGEHDQHCGPYGRNETIKIERIGKKYQWITMYNMLARISDHCKMIDRWNCPKKEVQYEGAWEPYVRDFDPTLNSNFTVYHEAPTFKQIEEHKKKGIDELKTLDITNKKNLNNWLRTEGVFLNELKDNLFLNDENSQQWVYLTNYCDTGRETLADEKLSIWSWMYAYFMSSEQADEFYKCAEKGIPVINQDIASYHESYTIFNREYPWSPSCSEYEKNAWVNTQIKTGKMETVTEMIQVSNISPIEALLRKYGGSLYEEKTDNDEIESFEKENQGPEIQYKEVTREREIDKEIGAILHATTDLLWEEEYDATKESSISISMPCGRIIIEMGLRQMVADGFYYDSDGKLAAFDTYLTQKEIGVVIRKDILDAFLSKTNMKLVWFVNAGKEIRSDDFHSIASHSDWEAVFVYEGDAIIGNIHMNDRKHN